MQTPVMAKPQPQPHVVVVPHPSLGHVNPALQLAQMLHHHGVFVTFVSTEHKRRRSAQAVDDGLPSPRGGPPPSSFRFETIPDGLLDADRGGGSTPLERDRALSQSTSKRGAAPLRELVARLRGGTGSTPAAGAPPPVTCVIPTALMSFALDVARELRIPSMVFWVGTAALLSCQMRLRELKQRGYLPLRDASCLTNGHSETSLSNQDCHLMNQISKVHPSVTSRGSKGQANLVFARCR